MPDTHQSATTRPSIPDLTSDLIPDENGVYFSSHSAPRSYPSDGLECYRAVEEESFWFCQRNKTIASVARLFPPNGFILDVGGGNGFVSRGLEEAGFSTVLLEPDPVGAKNGKERGLPAVICSTLEDAHFKNHSVSAIGSFDVLEHLPQPLELLQEFRRVLVPDGRLYLTVPALRALWSNEDKIAGHHERYSVKTLASLLEQSGFEVDYATYFFAYLPLPIFLLRSLPYRLGQPVPQQVSQVESVRYHKTFASWIRPVLGLFHGMEMAFIQRQWRIPTGSSIIITARAK
ncbi:TPA: hypothetical protein DDW35_05105 [Candidatus Sumerlaeota bacterium]|nr:hypothetical protein [Candidatus Sumerlaeota bacterium]